MREGSYVRIKGLRSRPEFNGHYGKLVRWLQSERWEVQLESEDGSQVLGTLSVKAQNLQDFCPELETTYMSKLLPKKQQGVTAPCFLQEFCDVCGTKNSWPQDICQKSASEFLLNGYMAATGLRWQRTLSGQHSPQISKTCFASLQLGDLLPEQAKWHDFHTFRTNFSNSPPSKMSMCANGTYIGVGVNDLRLLLDASIEEGAVGMRFVGIDLNDFAVARSLVITAMLRNSDIPVTHILQVWYSSTWSWETVSSFKQTLSVMEFPKKSSRVKQLLEFWKSAEAPDLRSSRQKWLNYFVSEERKWDACTGASFTRLQDRLAACEYFITGEVCDGKGERPEVGSITMWSVPLDLEYLLPLHNADSIFATMNLEDFLPVHAEAADIVQLFVKDVLKKLNFVRKLLLDGKLEIEIWQEEVVLANCQVIKRISALSPAGISWSNILDYTDVASFHSLAIRCSAANHSTMHYAYSMEWVKDVYGIPLSDWCRGRQLMRASMLAELETGPFLQTFAAQTQMKDFLALPGFGCPSRIWMYVTAMYLHPSWVARFVTTGSAKKAMSLHFVGMCLPFIMHRRFPTNIYLQWSYTDEKSVAAISRAMHCYNETLGEIARRLFQPNSSPWPEQVPAGLDLYRSILQSKRGSAVSWVRCFCCGATKEQQRVLDFLPVSILVWNDGSYVCILFTCSHSS